MTSRELRAGNWVNDVGSMPFQIDAADIVALEKSERSAKISLHYNPIPLTSEILEKFGLVKKEPNIMFHEIGVTSKMKWGIKLYFIDGLWKWCANEFFVVDLKYAHTFQNLYFALTGNEIVYTP